MKMNAKISSLLALSLLLSGCSNFNLFKDSSSDAVTPPLASPAVPAVTATPAVPTVPTIPSGPGAVSGNQIKSLLAGKSWRWKGPKYSGVTLYASDGTSLVEVTGKGTTQGHWVAKDGQLCESFAPASFLPQGAPMTCKAFTGGGGIYRVGEATFQLAS